MAGLDVLACKDTSPPLTITVTAVSPGSGPPAGGTSIIITGTHFLNVTSVSIGGAELGSRAVPSSTQITGITPAATSLGMVDVAVTSSSHGTATCTGCFSYSLAIVASPLAAGGYHSCALTNAGAAYCWGRGGGYGATASTSTPVAIPGALPFAALAAGPFHTCGLTSGGAAYCWGDNDFGQLGDGSTTMSSSPVAVSGGLNFSTVDAGGRGGARSPLYGHTCGLTSDGAAFCWGANDYGQLGAGFTSDMSAIPLAVAGESRFSILATGRSRTCALTPAGMAYCWGGNRGSAPVAEPGALLFAGLDLGGREGGGAGAWQHICALTSTGRAYCWGDNTYGQLGDGSTTSSSAPVAVSGGLTFVALATGGTHTCGLTSGGVAYCWGDNDFGQLGDGSSTNRSVPGVVSGGLTFSALAAGDIHTCGRTSAGALFCWGYNGEGQLGDGSTTNSSVPVAVVGWPPP